MHRKPSRLALAVACLLPLAAGADTKPPQAQYWVDVATNNSSIPGMPGGMGGMGGMEGMGGMMGQMMGMGGGPQKSLNLWLYSRNPKPAAPEATHDIPAGLGMGPTLPLVLPRVEKAEPSEYTPTEKPKARLVLYWGCGEAVRQGQPKVADTDKMSPLQFAQVLKGRSAPDRGPWGPGRAFWPNERDNKQVPAAGSLQGDHFVHGNYTPDIRFRIGQQQEFMEALQLTTSGSPAQAVRLDWRPVPNALGYFIMAIGQREKNGEMIVWTSSEVQETGFGLMNYLPNDFVRKLIGERVILAPSVRTCAIPQGIFDGAEGAMVRMIAYGEELNLAQPPRPSDPKATWEPIWTAKVRVKSETTALLGMGEGRPGRGAGREQAPRTSPNEQAPAGPLDPVKEGVDALKKILPF